MNPPRNLYQCHLGDYSRYHDSIATDRWNLQHDLGLCCLGDSGFDHCTVISEYASIMTTDGGQYHYVAALITPKHAREFS
jgi:hypothetical protein